MSVMHVISMVWGNACNYVGAACKVYAYRLAQNSDGDASDSFQLDSQN